MSNIIPYKVLVKILLENGWELDHTTGSHEIYIKDGKTCPVKCTKKDIPNGTLASIKRITGLKFQPCQTFKGGDNNERKIYLPLCNL